jgi:hypothetical protein
VNELRTRLIEQARNRHKRIYPCANQADFEECFTITGNRLMFWFNTEDHSTHLVVADCDEAAPRV